MVKSVIDTPCIGVCSTVYGDVVCRGCKRFFREVIEWNSYDTPQKQIVYQRLSQLMSTVVQRFLIITDENLLKQQLDEHSVRFHASDDAFCWAHHLLRVGVEKIEDVTKYGIALHPEFQHCNLRELFTLMDEALYEMSGTFYEGNLMS